MLENTKNVPEQSEYRSISWIRGVESDCVETVGLRKVVSSLVTCLESRRQRGFGPREHIPLPSGTSKTILTGTSDRKSSILGENEQTNRLPLSLPFSLSSFHSSYLWFLLFHPFICLVFSKWNIKKCSVLFCQTWEDSRGGSYPSPHTRAFLCSGWKSSEEERKIAGNSTERERFECKWELKVNLSVTSLIQRVPITQPSHVLVKKKSGCFWHQECLWEVGGRGEERLEVKKALLCFSPFSKAYPFWLCLENESRPFYF